MMGALRKEVCFSALWKDSFPCTAINLMALTAPLGLALAMPVWETQSDCLEVVCGVKP